MRQLDEPIPPQERLFRSVAPDDCQGTTVLPGAIDHQGTSVVRQKYSKPRGCLSETRPLETGIIYITPGSLPSPIKTKIADVEVEWHFYAVDCPEPGNEPHAEIRVRRAGNPQRPCPSQKGEVPPKSARTLVKDALADRMTILVRPGAKNRVRQIALAGALVGATLLISFLVYCLTQP
jgi:hypothetical protein